MLRPVAPPATLSIAKTRAIVKDLFTPSAAIYWSDFLGSMIVGSAAFFLVRRTNLIFGHHVYPLAAVLYVVAVILYYRAALFVHELAHLRDKTFRAFRIVWNLMCGIPFLMPSFLYYSHVDHHMRKHFGTHDDGEYLPLATTGLGKIFVYLTQPLLIPILAVVRFLVLAPLGWICPPLRRWLHRRASSLVMDPSYSRPIPSRKALRVFRLQEAACFLVCLATAILLIRGRVPIGFLIQAYATSVGILYLNHIRTLGAHRYINEGREEMTFVDQLLDSINYPHSWILGEIAMPVGLRYHALHHLFPALPYHNLGRAHQCLMAELPADSPYRQTNSPSLWASLRQLWARSRNAGRQSRRENVAQQSEAEQTMPANRLMSPCGP